MRLAADADMFAEVSELLGYPEKAEEARAYAGRVREAFYEEYVEEGGKIRQEMQGNYILALKCHMVPKEMEPALAGHLNELVQKNVCGGILKCILCGNGTEALLYPLPFYRI